MAKRIGTTVLGAVYFAASTEKKAAIGYGALFYRMFITKQPQFPIVFKRKVAKKAQWTQRCNSVKLRALCVAGRCPQ